MQKIRGVDMLFGLSREFEEKIKIFFKIKITNT